ATDKMNQTGVNIKSEILSGIKEYESVRNNNQLKTNSPKIAQEILYGFLPSSLYLSDRTAGTTNIKITTIPIKTKNNKEMEIIITLSFYFNNSARLLNLNFKYYLIENF